MYYVYMLRCADDTLYTGTAADVQKRLNTHNSGKGYWFFTICYY